VRTLHRGLRVGLSAGLLGVSAVAVVAAPAHATVTSSFMFGILTVTSDDSGDDIVLTCPAGNILINGADPNGASLPCSAVIDHLVVLGNGGEDDIDVSGLAASAVEGISVDAGDGIDQVVGGGFTTGNPGQVSISGGAGGDLLFGKGSDVVKGGPGDDFLIDFGTPGQILDGEAGTDTYAFDFTPAGQVGLDLTPLNGGLVAQIAGGSGEFFAWSSIEAVDVVMNAGNNEVNLFAFDGTSQVFGAGGNDTLTGGAAADQLFGGPGDDTIEGGGGADSVQAGDGDDLLRMADSVADSVDCGRDSDIVVADPSDALVFCETVEIPPQPAVPDTTKPEPSVGVAKLKDKRVRVPIRCPASEVRCVGEVALKVVGKRNGKTRKIAIGRALVVADGGDRERVKLSVSKATANSIRALTKPKLKVAYDLVDVAGNKAKGTVTVKLKVP
jgi:RTX calcium-binding nonapeptide repeat (4 copies)